MSSSYKGKEGVIKHISSILLSAAFHLIEASKSPPLLFSKILQRHLSSAEVLGYVCNVVAGVCHCDKQMILPP